MPDPFATYAGTIDLPADAASVLTPSDTDAIAQTPKAIYVGGAGHIVARGIASTADVVFRNVPAGTVLRFRPGFVRATGTTATDLLALY